jgi:hypothetical protein
MCSAATAVVCAVLSLQVINDAETAHTTMTLARAHVERYFHHAGIAVDWNGGHDARLTIVLTTTMRMQEIDRGQRGVLGAGVTASRRAYVLIDRIEARALEMFQRSAAIRFDRPDMLNRTASDATFIALVMAHEIGHLLLPPDSHSRGGVMSKNITLDVLRRAIDRTLVFSPDQRRAMRAALTAGSTAALRAH